VIDSATIIIIIIIIRFGKRQNVKRLPWRWWVEFQVFPSTCIVVWVISDLQSKIDELATKLIEYDADTEFGGF